MMEDVKDSADRLIGDRLAAGDKAVIAAKAAATIDRFQSARGRVRLLRGCDEAERKAKSLVDCCDSKCVVQQQFADEVDINTIVRRFGMTQTAPPRAEGVYGDFTGIHDFESALASIERARAGFDRLPPEVREKFGNDPGRFYGETGNMTAEQLDGLVPALPVPVKAATLDDVVAAVKASQTPVEGVKPSV